MVKVKTKIKVIKVTKIMKKKLENQKQIIKMNKSLFKITQVLKKTNSKNLKVKICQCLVINIKFRINL